MIDFEMVLGPIVFDISHDKRIRKIKLVVSKEVGTTLFMSTSNSDIGDFGTEKEITVSDFDLIEIHIPPKSGYCFRIKLRGTGNVKVHEIIPDVIVRGI